MPFPARGENVKLGKGSLLLDYLNDSGQPTGLDFVGNMTGFSLTWDITQVEKYSSTERTGGLVARDRTRAGLTVSAQCDEWTSRNLQSYFLAGEAAANQGSASAQSVALDDVVLGRYYEIGARRVTNVEVLKGSIPLTLNEDYELNSEFGMVHILAGGTVVAGDDLVVMFDKPALTITKLQLGTKSSQIARALYLADDANSSGSASKDRLELWRVDVAPDGEVQLIGDDYGSFTLTMGVLVDATHPGEPYGTLTRVTG
jgi:hypothetical protein